MFDADRHPHQTFGYRLAVRRSSVGVAPRVDSTPPRLVANTQSEQPSTKASAVFASGRSIGSTSRSQTSFAARARDQDRSGVRGTVRAARPMSGQPFGQNLRACLGLR